MNRALIKDHRVSAREATDRRGDLSRAKRKTGSDSSLGRLVCSDAFISIGACICNERAVHALPAQTRGGREEEREKNTDA